MIFYPNRLKKIKVSRSTKKFKEAGLLKLNCNKAKKKLNWQSVLDFPETIKLTASWYKNYYINKKSILELTKGQIIQFMNDFEKKINIK